MSSDPALPSDDDAFDILCDEFVSRLRGGEAVDVETYAVANPTLAERIRELFPVLAVIEGLKPGDAVPRASSGSAGGTRPFPDRIDDLSLVRVIGEGGMGRVFEARDADGTRVAVKLIHPHLSDRKGLRERFEREVELGRRIDHPGVVRTLRAGRFTCHGVESPYVVLEYVEGQNLTELLDQVGTVSERLACEIGVQVAEALGAVHAAGVVHRDVKPENVVITPDEVVKLMDLGVALLVEERRRLTATGEFVGTLLYAAPEQLIVDSQVGPPADMHGLGLLLYQLVVGEHPHAGRHGISMEKAPSLRSRAPHVSPFLDRLVAALLERDPEARPGPAADVADTLRAAEQSRWWKEQSVSHAPSLPMDTTEAVRFHGRGEELLTLDRAWEAARSGEGPVRAVIGEAGIGKSRLVREWLSALRRRDIPAHVIMASHGPGGLAVGNNPLNQAFLDHFGQHELEARLERLLGPHAALAGALAQEMRGVVDAPETGLSEAARMTAWARMLRGIARDTPVVLVWEDVHFANDASRGLLLALAHALENDSVLILFTSRPELDAAFLDPLRRIDRFERIDLGGLDLAGSIAVVRDAMGSDAGVTADTSEYIDNADGNPFCLIEFAREVRARRGGPDDERFTIPRSVREMVEVRLRSLSTEARSLLGAAACCGNRFDPLLVCEAGDLPRIGGLRLLHEVDQSLGLVEPIGNEYRFRHHLVQEVLQDELPPALRCAYHAALGDAIESKLDEGESPRGAAAWQLARHFVLAGTPERALPYAHAAFDHLMASMELREGARLARALVEVDTPKEPAFEAGLQRRLAIFLMAYAPHKEVLPALEAADALRDAHGDPVLAAEVLIHLGYCRRLLLRYDEAVDDTAEAIRLVRGRGAPSTLARALAEHAMALEARGRLAEAYEASKEALELSREAGNAADMCVVARNLGAISLELGRMDEAKEMLEHAVTIAQLHGETINEMSARLVLAKIAYLRADPQASLDILESVCEIGHRRGHLRMVSVVQTNMAQTLLQLGRFDEALAQADEAVLLCSQLSYGDVEAHAQFSRSQILWALGRFEACRQAVARGRDLLGERAPPVLQARLSTSPTLVLAWSGRYDEAEALLSGASRAVSEANAPREALLLRLCEASVLEARNELEAMTERLQALEPRLDELGSRLEAAVVHMRLGVGLLLTGRSEEAQAQLETALRIEESGALEGAAALTRCFLALLPGGNPLTARMELEKWSGAMQALDRVRAWATLAERTGARTDRRKAADEVEALIAGAPEAWREKMRASVPLYRQVLTACDAS